MVSLDLLLDEKPSRVFPAPPADSVLYLPMYPPLVSPTRDWSGQGNHGAITGATWVRLPSGLWVLNFDGGDRVDCGTNASLNLGTTFSIEAWIKTTAVGTGGILSNNASIVNGDFQMGVNVTKAYYYAANTLATTRYYYNEGSVVNTGNWVHLMVTRNEATFKDYKNGVLDLDKTDFVTGDIYTTGNTYLGWMQVPSDYWVGQLALLRIYNRVLSATEIAQHFQQERHLFGVW